MLINILHGWRKWFKEHHKLGKKSGRVGFQASRATKTLGACSVLIWLHLSVSAKSRRTKGEMGVRLTHPAALHCLCFTGRKLCTNSYPLSDFSVAWKGSGVPEFVVSEFLTPFYPAHHLLAVPVASLLSDPSAGLRWTHPRLSSVCATVICSGLPPSSALPGLKAPPGGDSSLTRGGRGPRLWRQLLAGPWKYVRRFLRAIMLHPSYFTTINPASYSWVDSQLYKLGVCI